MVSVSLLFFAGRTIASDRTRASDVVDLAASLIGRPYVWGAEGPTAFDCSGLTQYVFQEFGIDLPRRAISQSAAGDPAGRRMQRGDLLFFSTDKRRSLVTHVGIYEGGGKLIEASQRYGRVRRSDLDEAYWADRFMFARRVTSGADDRDIVIDRDPRSDDPVARVPRRRDGVRGAAIRALKDAAEILLRRPGR
jgi:cell wall-associated NlpC family hydrolase